MWGKDIKGRTVTPQDLMVALEQVPVKYVKVRSYRDQLHSPLFWALRNLVRGGKVPHDMRAVRNSDRLPSNVVELALQLHLWTGIPLEYFESVANSVEGVRTASGYKQRTIEEMRKLVDLWVEKSQ